jgi:uncharacterized protein YndB with AHSA1/START domain
MVLRFGPRGDARYTAIGRYLEIQPDRRIVAAGTMSDGAELVSASLSTAEFLHEGSGTRLVYTEQSAFFGEESPADRRKGWNVNLEKLAAYLDGLRAQRAGSGQ